jgi:hypothetical protein
MRKRVLQLDAFPGQVKEYNCLETTTSLADEEPENEDQQPFSRPAIPVFDGGRGSVNRGTFRTGKRRSMSKDAGAAAADHDDTMDVAARRALWESSIPDADRSLYYGRSYVPWSGTYLS